MERQKSGAAAGAAGTPPVAAGARGLSRRVNAGPGSGGDGRGGSGASGERGAAPSTPYCAARPPRASLAPWGCVPCRLEAHVS